MLLFAWTLCLDIDAFAITLDADCDANVWLIGRYSCTDESGSTDTQDTSIFEDIMQIQASFSSSTACLSKLLDSPGWWPHFDSSITDVLSEAIAKKADWHIATVPALPDRSVWNTWTWLAQDAQFMSQTPGEAPIQAFRSRLGRLADVSFTHRTLTR